MKGFSLSSKTCRRSLAKLSTTWLGEKINELNTEKEAMKEICGIIIERKVEQLEADKTRQRQEINQNYIVIVSRTVYRYDSKGILGSNIWAENKLIS